jgi:uncharacterized membrane-anchored protein
MKRVHLLGCFIVLALVQAAVPLAMIARRESVYSQGTSYKFKTAPVDPYDAFRGRYVALRVEAQEVSVPAGVELHPRQTVYVRLETDDAGFGRVAEVWGLPPRHTPYAIAKVAYLTSKGVAVQLPIDRYYMEETAAQRAERMYAESVRTSPQDSYCIVKVKDGMMLVEGVYIGGVRLEDAVRQEEGRKQ